MTKKRGKGSGTGIYVLILLGLVVCAFVLLNLKTGETRTYQEVIGYFDDQKVEKFLSLIHI